MKTLFLSQKNIPTIYVDIPTHRGGKKKKTEIWKQFLYILYPSHPSQKKKKRTKKAKNNQREICYTNNPHPKPRTEKRRIFTRYISTRHISRIVPLMVTKNEEASNFLLKPKKQRKRDVQNAAHRTFLGDKN